MRLVTVTSIGTLAVVALIGLACTAAPAQPTSNIDAALEVRLAQEGAIETTGDPRVKEQEVAQPTAVLAATPPPPAATNTPVPADPPVPTHILSAGKSLTAGREGHTNTRVGNKVGDISPDFSILLTTGEKLYSSTIRSDGMPVFLFFFSPH